MLAPSVGGSVKMSLQVEKGHRPGQSPSKGSWVTLLFPVMVTFTADTAPVSWAWSPIVKLPAFT
ncbi:hypothetical protein D3C78_647480 [compost metagenome]